MQVIAVNGSPRKNWNTAMLLRQTLDGAESKGAKTQLVHLYDIDYKGCISCFACKLKNGPSHGRCVVNDGLKPLLDRIHDADALVLGSPIYFGSATGEMRAFQERLLFQYLQYKPGYGSLFGRTMPTACIYTMNVPHEALGQIGYEPTLKAYEASLKRTFGQSESLLSTDTLQFEDYSRYEASAFDEKAKKNRREEVFPEDCRKAFELGVRLANDSRSLL